MKPENETERERQVDAVVGQQPGRDIEDEICEQLNNYISRTGRRPKFLILSRKNRHNLMRKLGCPMFLPGKVEMYMDMELCIRQHWNDEPIVAVAA